MWTKGWVRSEKSPQKRTSADVLLPIKTLRCLIIAEHQDPRNGVHKEQGADLESDAHGQPLVDLSLEDDRHREHPREGDVEKPVYHRADDHEDEGHGREGGGLTLLRRILRRGSLIGGLCLVPAEPRAAMGAESSAAFDLFSAITAKHFASPYVKVSI